ncbi:cholesterol 7-desaturase nvd isoform X2 [Hermetia illucens]|uniref:cholesterol 7-desaturase nvd isoform X2 n=1 Tax=Hermetia illucens TaxID=343691 RepID=UPI0018CBF77E|nr:cholesterol 7-desaturase nvd isoform X2 [Hermetia illucens]
MFVSSAVIVNGVKIVKHAMDLPVDDQLRLLQNFGWIEVWDAIFYDWWSIRTSFSILLGFVLALFLYWVHYVPVNWTKDLTEVGYEFLTKNRRKESKIQAINRARKLRKTTNDHMPPPFPNGWFAIAESYDVKRNEVIDVSCLGQHFAVFRTESGDAHVLDAYCPHLGANIAVGGTVRGDCIECPFHQWAFRGSDGQCVNAAYSSSDTAFKNTKLKKWISNEINGAIFIWHHAEGEDPWHIPLVKEIETEEWIYQGRNEFLINCHIQEIPENGADNAHLIAVHGPNVLTGSDLRFTRASWATFLNHWWDASWRSSTNPNEKHIATAILEHSTRLFNKLELHHLDVQANQIGPAYVQLVVTSTFGLVAILQTVTPVEPLVQKVIHRFYSPRKCGFFTKFMIWAESVMFERDMMVWNHKVYLHSPCLLKEDRNIKLYRAWYSQFYSENSKTFAEAKDSMEW